ncbi:hypothetical protein Tco_0377855 [Tanacetum coccineum]
MAPLTPHDQRHLWLCYQVEGYTEEIVHDFEQRLETIFGRQLGGARRSMTWRQFILALGLHTAKEMAKDGFGAYWLGSERLIPDKGDLSDYWVAISSGRDFLRGASSYTYIRDLVWRLCHRLISYNISVRGHAPEKATLRREMVALVIRRSFIGPSCSHLVWVSDDIKNDTSLWPVAPGPERQQDYCTVPPKALRKLCSR